MKMIIGLGNPGSKYQNNRHNVGFIMLDEFAKNQNLSWSSEKKLQAEIAKGDDLILVKPQTYMNKSGAAVSKVINYYKEEPKDLILLHDDVDLPFNKIRVKFGSGAAGHKGVESVFAHLGTKEMWRIRFGVGRHHNMAIDTEAWVLMDFTLEELDIVRSLDLDKLVKETLGN